LVGWIIVILDLVLIFLAPVLAPFPPETTIAADSRQAPNVTHWFGTDATGLDIFSRVIYAPRVDLTIAILGNLIALAIGIPLGLLTGFYQGLWVALLLRIADVIQSFPVFVLAMVLVAVSGVSIQNVILAIAFVQGPIYLRLIRGDVLSLRKRRFVDAARCVGNNDLSILYRHVLPNSAPPAAIQFSVNLGFAVLLTAGLSFVGAGVRVPTPEWGSMVSIGAPAMITGEWWMAFFPGLAIALTVLGFALVADSLHVILDPTSEMITRSR
jgi:peptide/nickel transport system permease protein